jgi:hypothetical protein
LNSPAAVPRLFLPLRFCALLPYAAAAAGFGLAPTQALLLGCVLELMFPAGTKALHLAMRHLCLWATLLFLLPDAFPLWLAPLTIILVATTHRWWLQRPRLAALWVVVLALPAMVDMLKRLEPETEVAAAAARNPWLEQGAHTDFGTLAHLQLPGSGAPMDLVIPTRLQPWPLQADQASRLRSGGLVLLALLLTLALIRRRSPRWIPLYLAPVLLTWLLTMPRTSLQIWIPASDGSWHLLNLDLATRAELREADAGGLDLRPSLLPAESVKPEEAVSWVERGALIAPKAGGDQAYWPLLRHWADSRLAPDQRAKASGPGLHSSRRWEIDARGHLILRPLP